MKTTPTLALFLLSLGCAGGMAAPDTADDPAAPSAEVDGADEVAASSDAGKADGPSENLSGGPSRGDATDSGQVPDPGQGPAADPSCPDTAPLPSPAAGALGPAARITSMRTPVDTTEARALGCDAVAGSNGGTGLTVLLNALHVDVDGLVKPDAAGHIESIILGHLAGWPAGQRGNATTDLHLHMYDGRSLGAAGQFGIDRTALAEDGGPKTRFPAALGCNKLETEPADLDFPLPVEGQVFPLGLRSVQVSGQLAVDPATAGFSITDGRIIGYVPLQAVVDIVEGIRAACSAPDAPEVCAEAAIIMQGTAEQVTRTLVMPMLHGLDARLDPTNPTAPASACTGAECNAMSICVAFDAAPISLSAD